MIRRSVFIALLSLAAHLSADKIPDCAFLGSDITVYETPENITSIGAGAFAGSSLKEITLPESLTSIGDYAFSGCESLSRIKLPSGIRSIGKGAFKGCKSLSQLNIPASVESIGSEAFRSSGLQYFTPDESSRLTAIDEWAFIDCRDLKTVILPQSLNKIGRGSFFGCPSLSEIILPAGLRELPELIFAGDSDLSELNLPPRLKSIGSAAMDGCTGLKRIDAINVEQAPSLQEDTWSGIRQENVNLYVASDAANSYSCDSLWNKFNIISETTSTGNIHKDTDPTITFDGSTLRLNAPEAIKSLKVYTIDGILLFSQSGNGSMMTVSLPSACRSPLFFAIQTESGKLITYKISLN